MMQLRSSPCRSNCSAEGRACRYGKEGGEEGGSRRRTERWHRAPSKHPLIPHTPHPPTPPLAAR